MGSLWTMRDFDICLVPCSFLDVMVVNSYHPDMNAMCHINMNIFTFTVFRDGKYYPSGMCYDPHDTSDTDGCCEYFYAVCRMYRYCGPRPKVYFPKYTQALLSVHATLEEAYRTLGVVGYEKQGDGVPGEGVS